MGQTPSRCALRGLPAAARIRSRRIRRLRRQDARANVGEADGPKGEVQDAPNNQWVLIPAITARKGKRPTRGVLLFWRREWERIHSLPRQSLRALGMPES